PAVNQQVTIGLRSIDESSCRNLLGDAAICSVVAELPDINKQDHLLIWALQVAGTTAGAPNAFAQSSNNRIIINKALDQAFGNDLEAKACVVAHELAHLQEDHSKQMKAALAKWNVDAAGKINAAVRNAHSANKGKQFWSAFAMVANAASAGLNASAGNTSAANEANANNQILAARQQADQAMGRALMAKIYQVAQGQAPEVFHALQGMEGLPASLVGRTMKDVDVYLAQVNRQAFALSRQHEHEADSRAVNYLAKAGIDPDGCLRVIAALHRGVHKPVANVNDTHPGEQERNLVIQQAITANSTLIARSKNQPLKPAPLAYRYDQRLDVVTVFPGGGMQRGQKKPATADVDTFLGR
ncbi:MAG: M48 family metalloprotease, partial [Synechococcaceae cyanobacterium]|nr:M48 family metalloprotease [Synechococcaceae cyanobacterium]